MRAARWMVVLSLVAAGAWLGGCAVACTPEECPNGCCGTDGICYVPDPGGTEGNDKCGTGGGICVDCTATGLTCMAGACAASCMQAGQGCATTPCCTSLVCLSTNQQCGTCLSSGSGTCGQPTDCCSESCDTNSGVCN
jgi:hypothetical protein